MKINNVKRLLNNSGRMGLTALIVGAFMTLSFGASAMQSKEDLNVPKVGVIGHSSSHSGGASTANLEDLLWGPGR